MLDAGRLDRRFRPCEPTWTGRVCAAPIGGSPSARMPDGPRPRLGRGPSPGAGLHLLNGGACGNLRPCAPMPRAAARRTPHAARSTPHEARSTKHEARSTPRRAALARVTWNQCRVRVEPRGFGGQQTAEWPSRACAERANPSAGRATGPNPRRNPQRKPPPASGWRPKPCQRRRHRQGGRPSLGPKPLRFPLPQRNRRAGRHGHGGHAVFRAARRDPVAVG